MEDSTINFQVNDFEYKSKIAAFDFDHTLVKPKSNSTFSKDEYDWQWLRFNVPTVLKTLHENGFGIVIFTNQSKFTTFKIKQIRNVCNELNIPVNIFIETNKHFKKPNPYMYNLYIEGRNNLNKHESFFVGDALGREGDFSDSDKEFAINCKLIYKSPEEVFGVQEKEICKNITIPDEREIIIMIGYPGSGKTTFIEKNFSNLPYIVLHGDIYKSEGALKKILKAKIMNENKSIILDATHSNKKKRKVFIEIAQQKKLLIRFIHINTSLEESIIRNKNREKQVPNVALYVYRKYFEPPELSEGINEIIVI